MKLPLQPRAGTTLLEFYRQLAAANPPQPVEFDFGDGASLSFDFKHGLGTYAVSAVIWDNATRTRQLLATESTPDLNTYRVVVAVAPTAKQYHIAIARLGG